MTVFGHVLIHTTFLRGRAITQESHLTEIPTRFGSFTTKVVKSFHMTLQETVRPLGTETKNTTPLPPRHPALGNAVKQIKWCVAWKSTQPHFSCVARKIPITTTGTSSKHGIFQVQLKHSFRNPIQSKSLGLVTASNLTGTDSSVLIQDTPRGPVQPCITESLVQAGCMRLHLLLEPQPGMDR